MNSLSQRDLDGLVEFLGALETVADERSFAELVSSGLRPLIPYDASGFNDVDVGTSTAEWLSDPVEVGEAADGHKTAFERNMLQHPVIAAFAERGDGRARRLSDLTPERRFHRTDLYNEFYRPLEIEHQLVCHWSLGPARWGAMALFRSDRDFSERDRTMLSLLRPYLALGQRTVRAQARAQQALGLFDDTLGRSGQGLITLTPRGQIDLIIGGAYQLLVDYFEPGDRAELPEELAGWTQAQHRRLAGHEELPAFPNVLVKEGARGRLLVQYLPPTSNDRPPALLLSEQPRASITSARVAALGLTPRETEILQQLIAGYTNEQIAEHLSVTVATVNKHLEHIYRKLDVHSRTAAIAKASAGTELR